jgi:hypothetical protein
MGVSAQGSGHDTNAAGATCTDGSSTANSHEAGTGLEGDQNAAAADEGVGATEDGPTGETLTGDQNNVNDETAAADEGAQSVDSTSTDCPSKAGDNDGSNSSLKAESKGIDQQGDK